MARRREARPIRRSSPAGGGEPVTAEAGGRACREGEGRGQHRSRSQAGCLLAAGSAGLVGLGRIGQSLEYVPIGVSGFLFLFLFWIRFDTYRRRIHTYLIRDTPPTPSIRAT